MHLRKRAWVKALLWEASGLIVLGGLSYLFMGSLLFSSKLSFAFVFIRVLMFYGYERAWKHCSWGKE
jgi:uncharacterized membrane protein